MTATTRLLGATALAATLTAALPATAQFAPEGDPRPGVLDMLTPDMIAESLFNLAITVTRAQMEVSYDYLTSDVSRGTFALAGLTLRPALDYDTAGQCEITVERATIMQSGGALGFVVPMDLTSGSLNFIGVEMSTACLEPDIADMARAVGLRRIVLDQAKIDLGYDMPTGEVSAAVTLGIEGVAQIDARGVGTYLVVPSGEFGWPEPAVRVSEAVMTVKDRGGWALVSPMLPGDFQNPDVIREIGTEALVGVLSDGTGPLGASDRIFIDQLMNQVAAYVADPGEITVEANLPDSGVVLSNQSIQAPIDLIRVLALTAQTSPSARGALMTVSEIEAMRAGDAAAQLELARAFLSGTGVPRNAGEALETALALTDDAALGGEAQLLVGQITIAADPAQAYAAALVAAEAGIDGAIAVLDAAEARLTTAEVLALQPGFAGADGAPLAGLVDAVVGSDDDDPRSLRQAAIDRLYGTGSARSYAQAWYFAVLAEASGDIAASSLIDEIAARFALRGPDAAAAWAEAREAAEVAALTDWVALDLPARFAAN